VRFSRVNETAKVIPLIHPRTPSIGIVQTVVANRSYLDVYKRTGDDARIVNYFRGVAPTTRLSSLHHGQPSNLLARRFTGGQIAGLRIGFSNAGNCHALDPTNPAHLPLAGTSCPATQSVRENFRPERQGPASPSRLLCHAPRPNHPYAVGMAKFSCLPPDADVRTKSTMPPTIRAA